MKKHTLYSLFFVKTVIRLIFIVAMILYLFTLLWWHNNPQNHTRKLWIPIMFMLICTCLTTVFYHFQLKHEKLIIDSTSIFYYHQRFLRSSVSFYPTETINKRLRIIAFRVDTDKTFLFSTFLQKKQYHALCEDLGLFDKESLT